MEFHNRKHGNKLINIELQVQKINEQIIHW